MCVYMPGSLIVFSIYVCIYIWKWITVEFAWVNALFLSIKLYRIEYVWTVFKFILEWKNCTHFGKCVDACTRIYMYSGHVYIVWFAVLYIQFQHCWLFQTGSCTSKLLQSLEGQSLNALTSISVYWIWY